MNSSVITKKERAPQVLTSLRRLGDVEFQRKAWIEGLGGKYYSAGYGEELCALYDGYNFESYFMEDLIKAGGSPELVSFF